ncbi:MAG: TIGR01777 family oxidoreductase [Verrucomicrobiaceae bacterium]
MRIGIIGGTGFIGRSLGREARQRGHRVVVFSRRKDLTLSWADEIRPIHQEGPVLDPTVLDVLINLAGDNVFGMWTAAKKKRIRDSRVDLTNRIVDALKECPKRPATFICASGSGAYGNRGEEILTEISPRGVGFLADVCADWEAAANRAQALGARVVLLRTGMVLGKDGGAWPLLRRVFSFCLGGRLGDGKQWVPWIHLDDEVGIILHMIEHPGISGPVNLAAPNPVTNAELTAAISRALKRPAILHAPAFALKLALGGLGSVVLESQRLQPQAALNAGYEFKYRDLGETLRVLL